MPGCCCGQSIVAVALATDVSVFTCVRLSYCSRCCRLQVAHRGWGLDACWAFDAAAKGPGEGLPQPSKGPGVQTGKAGADIILRHINCCINIGSRQVPLWPSLGRSWRVHMRKQQLCMDSNQPQAPRLLLYKLVRLVRSHLAMGFMG